jgi:hypothetical protein
VTDTIAKPASTGSQGIRSRKQASRVLQYVLLQALIVIVCIFALRQPLPEPPSRYLVTAFTLEDRGTTRSTTLPNFVPSRSSMSDPALYRGSFAYDSTSARDEAQRAWSVYLPRFTNGVEVIVNGVEILDSRRDPSANRPDRAAPEIALIPASLLRDGANDLTIKLYVWGPISGFLDRISVGPDEALRHYYEQRTLLFVTLPMVFAAWQGILAVILIVLWAVRRHEPAYGALAAAMGLGAIQAFLPSAMDQPAHPELNATLLASGPLESACADRTRRSRRSRRRRGARGAEGFPSGDRFDGRYRRRPDAGAGFVARPRHGAAASARHRARLACGQSAGVAGASRTAAMARDPDRADIG